VTNTALSYTSQSPVPPPARSTRRPSSLPLVPLADIHLASARLIADWLKWDSWVREQHNRLLSIWENSTQEWAYDQGISPRLSIAKGKIVPEGAKEEHQRQKALGWDVSGNLDKE